MVVHLPDGSGSLLNPVLTRDLGSRRFIDLRPGMRFGQMHFEHDAHYSPEGHRRVAKALVPLLAERIPELE